MTFRLLSAAVGLPLLVFLIWVGSPWFTLLVAGAAALGALEMSQMARQRGRHPVTPVTVVWAVALVGIGHSLALDHVDTVVLGVASGLGVLAAIISLAWYSRREIHPLDLCITAGAALYPGGLLAFGPLIRGLDQGREWVFLLVLVTFAADTSAFLIGKAVGKRSLAPKISPGKTWEGAVAGFMGAVLASLVLVKTFDLGANVGFALLLGALMGVVGQIGDLTESVLKRAAGVKDSGWIIPGHGGILDRLDSIVFNLVLLYYFIIWGVQ